MTGLKEKVEGSGVGPIPSLLILNFRTYTSSFRGSCYLNLLRGSEKTYPLLTIF